MQTNKTPLYIAIIIGVAILLTLGLSLLNNASIPSGPGQYDGLAQCLKDKGAKFYGAFWCPHCAEQKKIFGASAKLLPYIECSTPDTQGRTKECVDAKIESYPTWVFADGTRKSGAVSPQELATISGCPLTSATSTKMSIDSGTSSPIKAK